MSQMRLRIVERDVQGITVLELHGASEKGDVFLQDTVERLLKEGKRNFVLHLGNVMHVTSSDIGAYVACLMKSRRMGGNVKLASVPSSARIVLLMTKLDGVFEMFSSEVEAAATFPPPA
jgi:anti-anti-sigma regulatory factor